MIGLELEYRLYDIKVIAFPLDFTYLKRFHTFTTPRQTLVSSMKTTSSINLMIFAHSLGSVPTHRPAQQAYEIGIIPILKRGNQGLQCNRYFLRAESKFQVY